MYKTVLSTIALITEETNVCRITMCVIDEHRQKRSPKTKKVFANIVGKIFMIFVGSEDNLVDVLNI